MSYNPRPMKNRSAGGKPLEASPAERLRSARGVTRSHSIGNVAHGEAPVEVLPGPEELYELGASIRGEATKRLRAAKPRLFSPVSESDGVSVKGH
jgi:hypothetical protein